MTKWSLFQVYKASSKLENQWNPLYQQANEEKLHENINWCRQSIWKKMIPIHDKNFQNNRDIEGLSQVDEKHLAKTFGKYHTYLWKAEIFPPKIRKKARVPTVITALQDSSRSSKQHNKARKGNKSIRIREDEINPSVFADMST